MPAVVQIFNPKLLVIESERTIFMCNEVERMLNKELTNEIHFLETPVYSGH
jgi:hypothetical protein